MTLEEQTKLINDLIRENPDVTIKEFIELKCELEGITKSTPKPTFDETIDMVEKSINHARKYKTDEMKYYRAFRFRC